MKIMHVDASAKRERSNFRALARYFLERLREARVDFDVDYLDLTVDTPPHVAEAFAIATYTPRARAHGGDAGDAGVIGCPVRAPSRRRRVGVRHADVQLVDAVCVQGVHR
ncbi:hypothetical protein OKW28_005174 [Paraburkholderia sp. 40]